MKDLDKWRGLKALVQDAVEHGATAIERVHLQTAARTFDLLQLVTPIAEPAKVAREVHDTMVSSAYASVRMVNAMAGKALDAVIDSLADTGERG